MFRDREQELERLKRQLLEEDEDEYEEDEDEYEEDEEEDEEEEDEEEEAFPDCPVYNTDAADVDLEEYSDAVYEEPRRSWGLVAAVLLLTAAVLLLLAYLLANRGGLLCVS